MGNLQIVLVPKPERESVRCEDQKNPLPIVDWMCKTCGEQALFAHPGGNVCVFMLTNRSYLTRSISDTAQKRSQDPAFLDPYVLMSWS